LINIDGKFVSSQIRSELKTEIEKLAEKIGKTPGLAAILVGENPASKVYVGMKSKACNEIGIKSSVVKLNENISEDELLNVIKKNNEDNNIHGILVQLPLPKHIDQNKILNSISVDKDVDGFHPYNVGNLIIGNDTFYPCTPYGIIELLDRYKIEVSGKHVVVVGRSNIVGKPIANMLLQKKKNANATVTVCHSNSRDISEFTRQADILIAAIGSPEIIKADMIKEGAVVIDVGVNRVEDNSEKGYKLVGDVDYQNVVNKVAAITPVPGGVGPMTIAMLMKNTVKAFKLINNINVI
jgi:methylenetetrahydrofolate dehydrogenase (NADP+)/methenyltetrahydrofolate cyclohydrolase